MILLPRRSDGPVWCSLLDAPPPVAGPTRVSALGFMADRDRRINEGVLGITRRLRPGPGIAAPPEMPLPASRGWSSLLDDARWAFRSGPTVRRSRRTSALLMRKRGKASAWTVIQTISGLSATGADSTTFTQARLRATYSYIKESDGATATAEVVLAINVPDNIDSLATPLGAVLFVCGTKGVGVGNWIELNENREAYAADGDFAGFGQDDVAACALASGRDVYLKGDPAAPYGRSGDPVVTIQYNNPGFGPAPAQTNGTYDYSSTENADFLNSTPRNDNGDDYCGPMSHAAIEAAVGAAFEYLSDYYGYSDSEFRLVLVSFSNGVTCAGGWMDGTSHDVHAHIEVEGPTDSFEQLLCSECHDEFGTYWEDLQAVGLGAGCLFVGRQNLATSWDFSAWTACRALPSACGAGELFGTTYEYYGRPPEELQEPAIWAAIFGVVFGHTWWPVNAENIGCTPWLDTCTESTPAYDLNVLATLGDFWKARKPATRFSGRKGAYIRVQDQQDHVQPFHYHNRHAWRALNYAQAMCGGATDDGDVFWADQAYIGHATDANPAIRAGAAPVTYNASYDGSSIDPDDATTFPAQPSLTRWATEVDLVRWAMVTTFTRGC